MMLKTIKKRCFATKHSILPPKQSFVSAHKFFAKNPLNTIKSCCNLYELTALFASNDHVNGIESKANTINNENDAA